jgi:hypothetical protein
LGQEATCICEWNGESARVKALVEPPELILRGEIRKRIPFAQMRQLRAENGALRFKFSAATVLLRLDAATAENWVRKFSAPLPSLAKKLGITPESTVWMMGVVDDASLQSALVQARAVRQKDADLILARANTEPELRRAFKSAAKATNAGVPIWILYRKGNGHPIGESGVRGAGLAARLVDVKVASVSKTLTALKFVRRTNSLRSES